MLPFVYSEDGSPRLEDIDPALIAMPVIAPAAPAGYSLALAHLSSDPPSQEESPKVLELVGRTYDHFCSHRPDPSAFPQVAMELMRLLDDADTSVSDICTLLRKDAALAAHVLRLANSPIYRASSPIERLDLAITRVGIREVSLVAAGVASRTLFDGKTRKEYARYAKAFDALYRNSTTMAFAASWLALLTDRARPERAFMAGLLCDIGASLALRSVCQVLIATEEVSDDEINRVVSLIHPVIGAEAMVTFKVPSFLVAACRDHHAPVVPDAADLREVHLVRVVHGAMHWVDNPTASLREAAQSARLLGLDSDTLDGLPDALTTSTEQSALIL